MSSFSSELGNRIKEERKIRCLKLTDLEIKTGITAGALSKIERGAVKVSAHNLFLIGGALGVSMDYLVWGDKDYIKKEQKSNQ